MWIIIVLFTILTVAQTITSKHKRRYKKGKRKLENYIQEYHVENEYNLYKTENNMQISVTENGHVIFINELVDKITDIIVGNIMDIQVQLDNQT